MAFLVHVIGCIECGVPSWPVAICDDMDEARKAASEVPSTWDSHGGDGFVAIYDLDACEDTCYHEEN